jgi:hypothetical protein
MLPSQEYFSEQLALSVGGKHFKVVPLGIADI